MAAPDLGPLFVLWMLFLATCAIVAVIGLVFLLAWSKVRYEERRRGPRGFEVLPPARAVTEDERERR